MALSLPFSSQRDWQISFLNSSFLPRNPSWLHGNINQNYKSSKNFRNLSISISCSSLKIVQSPSLDRHIVKQNKIRSGLPPNFRSRLCNDHPDKFKTVDTSYGRALELVSWDPQLTNPLPSPEVHSHEMIVDRPLKFKQLRLRKGLNLKRRHQDFLIKFGEMPAVCPYNTSAGALAKESMEEEKRACAVVREVLGMMIEKRTLIDHLTHFRKEFGLPNKLRGMLVRHAELFYVSLKGQRDSVFLVEGYDEKGALLEKDEALVIKDQLMALVKEGNRMRRERRKAMIYSYGGGCNDGEDDDYEVDNNNDDHDDGLDDLFDYEDPDLDCVVIGDDESSESLGQMEDGAFWTADSASLLNNVDGANMEPW
ncbi:hypothetical protein SLA2020_415860 [Shorea laevis]